MKTIGLLLVAEAAFAAFYVAQLLSALPGHDASVTALISLRGLVGALQFVAGWMLMTRRAPAVTVARWAVVAAAAWVLLGVGFNLAPTSIYPWWRWQATAAYFLYALALLTVLARQSKST